MSEKMFVLDIELWHAVRTQNKRGELLKAVQDDHSLDLAMKLVKECFLSLNQQQIAEKRQPNAVTVKHRNTATLTRHEFKQAIAKKTKYSALIEKLSRVDDVPKLIC